MEKDVLKARVNPFLLHVTSPYSSVMKACKSSYTLLVEFTLRTVLSVCCYIIRDAVLVESVNVMYREVEVDHVTSVVCNLQLPQNIPL